MVCGRIIISLNKANCWLYGWLTKPCVVQSAVVCCDLVFGNGRRVGLTAPPTMTFQGEDRCVEMSSLYCETSALHFATSLTNMACVLRLVVVSTWNITWYVSWFVAVPERRDSAIETNSALVRKWLHRSTSWWVDMTGEVYFRTVQFAACWFGWLRYVTTNRKMTSFTYM